MPGPSALWHRARMNILHDDRQRSARGTLLARAAELRYRLVRVRSDLRREREPLPQDAPDAAIAMENDEVLEAIQRASTLELEHIEAALERINQGVYGLCAKCAAPIEEERLRVVPYADTCRCC
jgi:RNA polymerase-binding transcription factor DksA